MKKRSNARIGIRLLLSVIYLMIITIIFVCGYRIYMEDNNCKPYQEATSTDDYSYIEVSKMSEKFAYSNKTNVGIHFVVEKEETGIWHTYLVAINEKKIKKYQKLIDYANGKTNTIPKTVKLYGYPENVDENLKEIAIKNINSFLPSTNEVKINNENYEQYLTNSYLDTTKRKEVIISPFLVFLSALLLLVFLLLILVLIDKKPKEVKKRKIKKKK